ncbi:MAG: YqgE/AlgH family protein [Rickettsiaceae bacterium]|nr:YqgE/AlgH family protein [Rickettsiaceae bacterium]MDP5083495.1 YqgE/AlgH family protein [Rickettsiaceae bacterium]
MIRQDFSNLTGKILIASPFAMEGNVFHKSLIYVIKHTDEGSVGLIFNHPINNAPANTLFKKIDSKINTEDLNLDIHLGGPVEVERGFFLHTDEYNKNLLFNPAQSNLAVSSNAQILQDIANGTGPQNSIFIIGYTGWSAGQMEFELENNLWLIAEPNHDLIFLENSEEKWSKALAMLGISTNDFVDMNLASC